MAYAKGTEVTKARTKAEIEETLDRFGATGFMTGNNGREAVVAFQMRDRRVLFRLRMPDPASDEFRLTPTGKLRSPRSEADVFAAEERRRWRALLMTIKAKLVAVEDGIETFEEAFMAHIMMPDGLTIADHVTPRIADAYRTGTMPPLLPPPPGQAGG